MPLICLIMFICFIGCGIVSLVCSFVPYGEIFVMPLGSIVFGLIFILVGVNDLYSLLCCREKVDGVYCGYNTYYGGNGISTQAPVFEYTYNGTYYREQTTQNGGTYAHSDIAMSFATWISPEFQLYIMKDYRRLKTDENSRLSLNWNLNREISKLNYRIHTDAIKENLIPPELTPAQVACTYANEADLLNVVLFGKTAKQWKNENPTVKGNMRDVATLNQLLVLANLESYNAVLINQGKNQKERMELLRQLAVQQLQTLEMISLNNFPKIEEKQTEF